jgi:hypothetical protein
MVFNVEKIIPVPKAVGNWVMDAGNQFMPFSAKTAYAAACISESRQEHQKVRLAVSETAVRMEDMRRQMTDLDAKRRARLREIARLSAAGCTNNNPALEVHMRAFNQSNDRFRQMSDLHARHGSALVALDSAEKKVADGIIDMEGRLELVKIEHTRHNALDMVTTDPNGLGAAGPASRLKMGNRVVSKLEFDERVREDMNQRYFADQTLGMPPEETNTLAKAQMLLADHADLLH